MVGSNVTQNEDGSYHYEYAVFNYNSDSAARSFYLALPQNVTVSNVGFKDVTYHSGEPFDGTDWTFSVAGGVAKWECTQTFAQNPNANALRWATMYNFWFDSNAAPTSAGVGMDLFKTSGAVFASAKVPANPCRRGDLDCNGVVNGADLGLMLAGWGTCGTPCPGDLDGNGVINGADIGFLLASWG
jgi:hypothetical protein